MQNGIDVFNSPTGKFVQWINDGGYDNFLRFLIYCGEDFFRDGWGYYPSVKGIKDNTIHTPNYQISHKGSYICISLDRMKDDPNRYMVNSMDMGLFFKKTGDQLSEY